MPGQPTEQIHCQLFPGVNIALVVVLDSKGMDGVVAQLFDSQLEGSGFDPQHPVGIP